MSSQPTSDALPLDKHGRVLFGADAASATPFDAHPGTSTGRGRKRAAPAWWGCSPDVDIVIRVPLDAEQPAGQSAGGGAPEPSDAAAPMREHRRLALHAGFLAAASPWFAAKVWRWSERVPSAEQHNQEQQERLCVHMDVGGAEDAGHLEAALKQVYTQQLPGGASQTDLLRMAAVADAFELSSVSAACVEQLAQLPAAELEWGTVTAAFALPAGLAGQDSSRQLLARAGQRVQEQLGCLDLVLDDLAREGDDKQRLRMQRLQALPHAALLALLQHEQTRVETESTAVAAVALWAAAQEAAGSAVGLQQRRQLAAAIRMVQLPAMYLSTVLPRIGWLRGIITPQHVTQLLTAKGMPQSLRCHIPATFFGSATTAASGGDGAAQPQDAWPPAWLADARLGLGCDHDYQRDTSIAIRVPVAELHACIRAGQAGVWAAARTLRLGGHELGARMEVSREGRVQIALAVGATGMVPDPKVGGELAAIGVVPGQEAGSRKLAATGVVPGQEASGKLAALGVVPEVSGEGGPAQQCAPVAAMLDMRVASDVAQCGVQCHRLYTDGSGVDWFFEDAVNASLDWLSQAAALARYHQTQPELVLWVTFYRVL